MIHLCRALRATLLVGSLLAGAPAAAAPVAPAERVERMEAAPHQLAGVDVNEHLGSRLPRSLGFRDQHGKEVTLGDYFDGKRPVLFTLNYSDCPLLCSLQLNGLVEGLKGLEWSIGRDFSVVTVGLDPAQTTQRSRDTLSRYLAQYGRPESRAGWHFLTGSEANVRAYADAIGFRYRYFPERKDYAHPAAIALATPDGRLARYLYGIQYEPKTLRLGLVEASEGRMGTTLDRLILYCFHYDSSEGRYAPVARRIMQVGGGASVLALVGLLAIFLRQESRRRRRLAVSTSP
jgi:protein SCO1/2